MRLSIEQTDTLVEYVDHAVQCELAECDQCQPLLTAAAAVLSDVRKVDVERQAIVVENVLGGADKKPRKCVGEQCATMTTLRCTLCKLPCCQRCAGSSGAHPHTVRVRSDIRVTYDVTSWGYWDIDGKACKDKRNVDVEVEVRDYGSYTFGIGSTKYTMKKEMQKQTHYFNKNGNRVEGSSKKTGERPVRHCGKVLRHGDVFAISADEWSASYFELLE
jgi:hypothetical protein